MSFYSQEYVPDPNAKRKHFWKYFGNLGSPILDLGCTTGNFLQWAPDSARGLDRDLSALAIAARRGFQVCRADFDQPLCFADDSFAAVNCSAVLEHVSDPLALLREIHRVLRKGGLAVILVPDVERLGFAYWNDYTHRTPFTREGLRRVAVDAGFDGFTIRRYPFNYLKFLPWASRPRIRETLAVLEQAIAFAISTDLLLLGRK